MASTVEAQKAPKKSTVTVVYNGRTATLKYQRQQTVEVLLRHALHEFGIPAHQAEMALFTAAGAELPPHLHLKDAGVRPGDELILRQRVVRGGS